MKLCGRRFSFCSKCGGELSLRSVAGRERLVCDLCGYVLYENPVVGVAVIVQNDNGAILLGRRSKDSTYSALVHPLRLCGVDEEVRVALAGSF